MKPLSTRDRWLLAALPGIALAGAWFVGLRDGFVVRRESAMLALDSARATQDAASPEIVAEQRGRAEDELDATRSRLAAVLARWSDPSRRATVVRGAAALLAQDGVVLASSAAAPPNSSGSTTVPHGLVELSRAFADRGGAIPELWRFELNGSFVALAAALQRMRSLEGFALPVAVAVGETTQGDGLLRLRLWMWI